MSEPSTQGKGAGPDEPTTEELREGLDELRAELGDTVEELAHRADVPTRLRAKRAEAAQRVQEQVAHAREIVAQTAPSVQGTVRERPGVASSIAVVLVILLISLLRRRRRR